MELSAWAGGLATRPGSRFAKLQKSASKSTGLLTTPGDAISKDVVRCFNDAFEFSDAPWVYYIIYFAMIDSSAYVDVASCFFADAVVSNRRGPVLAWWWPLSP